MSPDPLEARTLGARGNGYAAPKTSPFLVDRAGISDLSIYGTHSDSDSIYQCCTLAEYSLSHHQDSSRASEISQFRGYFY